MVEFKLLVQFPVKHLPTESSLVLYSFCANLLHSLFMWLIVSSLSPDNLHLLLSCVLSISALTKSVLLALFYTAIKRDSISFLFLAMSKSSRVRFRFLSLEMSIQLFFFPFLFSSYFYFVNACVVCIVSGRWNQSSSALFFM